MMGREVKILLVEDDDGDAKTVLRAFAKAGIANPVVRAIDGMEALSLLRGSNGKDMLQPPHILLVDINMPRMGGLALVKALREDPDLKRTVAFILTTSKHDADKMAAYELNVAGYIVKENAGADFLDFVRMIGGYARIVELP
jgi:CheY-like chemotaxis protein